MRVHISVDGFSYVHGCFYSISILNDTCLTCSCNLADDISQILLLRRALSMNSFYALAAVRHPAAERSVSSLFRRCCIVLGAIWWHGTVIFINWEPGDEWR